MFEFIFPKKDLNNKQIWAYLSDKNKKKFQVYESVCCKCHKKSDNFETHSFCKSKFDAEQVVICFYYSEQIKKYILNFKYFHRKDLYKEIWGLMNIFFNIYFWEFNKENTIITCVPMHFFRKYFIKWYNQWELLANFLSEQQKIKFINVCRKKRYTKPQAKIKKASKRIKNIKDSFKCLELNQDIKNIIIVDDIFTTWSTITELSKTIKTKYPHIKIYSIVLARK